MDHRLHKFRVARALRVCLIRCQVDADKVFQFARYILLGQDIRFHVAAVCALRAGKVDEDGLVFRGGSRDGPVPIALKVIDTLADVIFGRIGLRREEG